MDQIISPVILYLALALGAVGVWLALPKRGLSSQLLGGLVAAAGGGLIILALTLVAFRRDALPNVFFYIFAIIALAASLRVITHPRPVYAALYFILTILSSAGLYLILAAEFMAFALVIVYAGAILITYLFVIMLATQAPTAGEVESLADYDVYSREPLAATVAGFALLAVLTTMLFRGVPSLPEPRGVDREALLAQLPRRVETALRSARVTEFVWVDESQESSEPVQVERTRPLLGPGERLARDEAGRPLIDPGTRTAGIRGVGGEVRTVPWPEDLVLANTEGVGFNLLNTHPGSIEIAGVVLLMAMLGAVVLARKKVQMEEEEKAAEAERLFSAPAGDGEAA